MARILKLFSQNQKVLTLIMGFGLILFLMPLYFVQAAPDPWEWPWKDCGSWDVFCILKAIGEYIISLPIRFAFLVLVVPIALLGLVAGFIFFLTVGLLSWIKTVALSVPIIHAGIVNIGWTFARDFANMFFLLILAFIGLATILKLQDYEAKKALPTLILIAIFMNFSLVIVGLIVDASNIFTRFFLDSVGDIRGIWGLRGIWEASFTYFTRSMEEIFTADGRFFENFAANMGLFIGIIVQGIALIVFYAFAALVFLVVVVLLFLRIIFLWILSILAPIAFLSKALPSTKTVKMVFPGFLHWDEWWEKLIQWSIVAIPIGFFLYLSSWIMKNLGTLIGQDVGNSTIGSVLEEEIAAATTTVIGTDFTSQFASLVTDMLEPTVAIVLLWLGFMISVKTAPEGAKWLMKGATAGFKAAGRGGASFLRQAAPAVGQWEKYAFGKAGAGLGLAGKGLGKAWQKTGAKIPGVQKVPGWVKRGAAAVPPAVGKAVKPVVAKVKPIVAPTAIKVAAATTAAAGGVKKASTKFWQSLPPDLKTYAKGVPKELKEKIGAPTWNAFLKASGVKKKKPEEKATKECPACGRDDVPEDATHCPYCPYTF